MILIGMRMTNIEIEQAYRMVRKQCITDPMQYNALANLIVIELQARILDALQKEG